MNLPTRVILFLLASFSLDTFAQSTVFSYQGQLLYGETPVTGLYDIEFTLWDASTDGTRLGEYDFKIGVPVTNGLFTVSIDFGPDAFSSGADRWLQMSVNTNWHQPLMVLSPRHIIHSVPYAYTARTITDPLPASQLTGTLAASALSGTYTGAVRLNNASNSFTGDGGGLQNVNAVALNGYSADGFWRLTGNNVLSGQFIGSTNNRPVEFRVNNQPAARIEPRGTNTPNWIGGATVNYAAIQASGATIAGGGAANYFGTTFSNSVGGDFSTIVGGADNSIGLFASGSVVVGGQRNRILDSQNYAVISGGLGNLAANYLAVIAGGDQNAAFGPGAVISGGSRNTNSGLHSIIGSGYGNRIEANAFNGVIGGGRGNLVVGQESVVAGGGDNVALALWSAIGGGSANRSTGEVSVIAGGLFNAIHTNSSYSVISGGKFNRIGANSTNTVIGGGEYNAVETNVSDATIAGGRNNSIRANSHYAVVGGGLGNVAGGSYAAVPGGFGNSAVGEISFAAGSRAWAGHDRSFVWSDGNQGNFFFSTRTNQFLIHAAEGVGIGTNDPQSQLHVAGFVTATGFIGDGSGLTNISLSNLVAVALLGSNQIFTASNLFTGVLIATNTNNKLGGMFTGMVSGDGSGLTNLNFGTTAVSWVNLTNVPAGFADGIDNDTTYTAGAGLNLSGNQISVNFSANGSASSVSRSDHTHNAAAIVNGTLADARLSPTVALRSATNIFTGSNWFYSVVTATNGSNKLGGMFEGLVSGDGSGLTNLNLGNLSNVAYLNSNQMFTASNIFRGVVMATNTSNSFVGKFTGDGAMLSNVIASGFTGVVTEAQLPPNLARLSSNQTFTASNTFAGVTTAANASNKFGGTFAGIVSGDGSALTNLNLPNLSNLAYLSSNQMFTASNIFRGVMVATNTSNSFLGKFIGDGSMLSNVFASGFTGLVSEAQLSLNVARLSSNQTFTASNIFTGVVTTTNTNNKLGGMFAGVVSGDGSGLTNLNLPTFSNAAYLTSNQMFTASNIFRGVLVATNTSNTFIGKFTGDGSMLSNVVASGFTGLVTEAQLPLNVARLSSNQTFTASNIFTGTLAATNANNRFGGMFSGVVSGDGAGLTNLTLPSLTNVAYLSSNQTFTATNRFLATLGIGSVAPSSALLDIEGVTRINDYELYLRGGSDTNHGLAWYGPASPAKPFAGVTVDGPVLYGYGGGALGTSQSGSQRIALRWDFAGNANVLGVLSGDGSGLSNVTARTFTGSIGDSQLPANIARVNSNQTFTAANTFSSTVTALSPNNSLSGTFNGVVLGDGSGLQNLATSSMPGLSNFWSLNGNGAGSANFLGTTNNQALELKVSSSRALRLEPNANSPNLIGGFQGNRVDSGAYGAVVAGGGRLFSTNIVSGNFGTVGGGLDNIASDVQATVAGGQNNRAMAFSATVGGGAHNLSFSNFATVAGGNMNQASNSYATVSGGEINNATAVYASIGGGSGNTARGDYATVAGGYGNWASGYAAAVAGGGGLDGLTGTLATNVASGYAAFVGGGLGNTSTGDSAVVAGGYRNTAALSCSVGGGLLNSATNSYATVPGGRENVAGGQYSFAAGRRAKALHNGSFVWGDSTDTDVSSTGTNQFIIRASGGVGIGLTSPKYALDVVGTVSATGGFNNSSDRNLKENFASVNAREILDKVSILALTRWKYKSDHTPHLGPMAQDFYAAFALGTDDKHIATIDADGVALAAIQGLNQKLDAQLKEKDVQMEALQKRIERLEKLLSTRIDR